MSDIARAREILRKGLDGDERFLRYAVRHALALMTRESPEFIADDKLPPLTREQVKEAIRLRQEERRSINDIARKLKTNIGRVSEAVNGLRKGV